MEDRRVSFCFVSRLLAAVLCGAGIVAFSANLEAAGTADIDPAVLADWIEQDQVRLSPPWNTVGKNKAIAEAITDDARFPLAHTQEILARAIRLLDRLSPNMTADSLNALRQRLDALDSRRQALQSAAGTVPPDVVSLKERRAIYLDARAALREIAFRNPMLQQIDKLLFITRHDPTGPFHMCDQYYGCNAVPGGGLYILRNPFGPKPTLVDVLANSHVENGRLQGRKLQGGSFLSPELSYDGRTILFAYSEAKATDTYTWTPECCYHLFRVNVDGSGLVQLTDGATDDFDPCFLPSGRIAFVSMRRGGYLRCGRHCPVYTLHSMQPDGSDVICLSYHETHEWHPSVNHEGMIVYTRWDYVDRDTNAAHHIWTCYPDGRDPRSFHGNYPERRESRPWMEMNIRAVPGSHKYVAVAAAHHGHEFGSLVLIDPRQEDDGAMSQLERLTPEVPFPEAERKPTEPTMVYGTPWPLSEDDYLCVYGADAKHRGVYWIDRDGNKELIYRDPAISCLSPIPVGARRCPPRIPTRTMQATVARTDVADEMADVSGEIAVSSQGKGTVAVMNIYDSDFTWPADTKIAALRVIQVLPKSTAPPNEPRVGVANQTNARVVLGTVPVESDGSVFFEAPVGMPIYFQALDEQGRAVQSMRSATYLHPGERLTCQGCHEHKHRLPPNPEVTPLALGRPASEIVADVEGSNPFNYPRLVQPVLDRHCVGCHQEKNAVDLTGAIDGQFTRSYNNLAKKYGFFFDVGNGSIKAGIHGGSRTTAGRFGAQAAPLAKYLTADHYGVTLSAEELHRITLWLDCNSEFLGAYEQPEAQVRGELVQPALQ